MKRTVITVLALCALGLAFAGYRFSAPTEKAALEERVHTAWTAETVDGESVGKRDGSIKTDVSAEAAAELRAAISGTEDAKPNAAAAETAPPTDPEAQYERALTFLDAAGQGYDRAEAETWLTLAARQGHIRAAQKLGDLYRDGTPKNIDRALAWYGYPVTFYMATGKLVGGTEEELSAIQEAKTALLIEKHKSNSSDAAEPMTAYETGEAIGAILKFMTTKTGAPQTAEALSSHSDPKIAACRAEALKHITTCKKGADYINCETWGCPEIVRCDGYARACEGHGAPYNSNDTFFCDKRNWRTRDFELEAVLQRACPAQ